jgi:hypothetical protein
MDLYSPQWNHDFKPLSLYQLSLFPVMPSVSYKVYFDPAARKARKVSEKASALEKANIEKQTVSAGTPAGSGIKDRWNIKAGYSFLLTGNHISFDPFKHKRYNFELNHGFLKNIEGGIYGGYSSIKLLEISGTSGRWHTRDAFFYGLNCNFHLLPYLIKKDDLRLDLYITGKIGAITIERFKSFEEHCLGGGATVYLWKHLGIFGEYNVGKFSKKPVNSGSNFYYSPVNKKVTLGLAVKFK